MSEWMDTETKAVLSKYGSVSVASSAVEFSLFAISAPGRQPLAERSLYRIGADVSAGELGDLLEREAFVLLKEHLGRDEVLHDQFELVCGGIDSLFVTAEVAANEDGGYLRSLCRTVEASAEYRRVVVALSESEAAVDRAAFYDQFFGVAGRGELRGLTHTMPWKKARILRHWAGKYGIRVDLI